MPCRIQCFLLAPTDLMQVSWRRYGSHIEGKRQICGHRRVTYPGGYLSTWDYHNASVIIEPSRPAASNDAYRQPTPIEKADPRWPKHCDCGYRFDVDDNWMVDVTHLYRRTETGELFTLTGPSAAPAGAMWNADWMVNSGHNPKPLPDGLFLVVRTPAGDWSIDGPSSNNNGQGWVRKGTPPNLTVTPSIGIGDPQRMHGWLGGGGGECPGVLVIDSP